MPINKQDSIADLNVTALLRQTWRSDIEELMVKSDVLVQGLHGGMKGINYLGKIENGETPSMIAGKILTDFTGDMGDEKEYSDRLNITLGMPLKDPGNQGNGSPIGTEETFDFKEGVLYSNDNGKAVSLEMYGITQRQQIPFKIRESVNRKIGLWKNEDTGVAMREAILETYCGNLTATPRSFTQVWSSNMFIPSLTDAQQPVYDPTPATYVTAVEAAFAVATASNVKLTLDYIIQMVDIARAKYMKPILYNNQYLFVFYVHPKTMRWLKNSANSGSINEYVKSVTALNQNPVDIVLPGAKWIVDDSVLIIEDERCPLLGRNTGTDAVNSHYMSYGRTDDRPNAFGASLETYAACYLLGEAALGKLVAKQYLFDEEIEDYGRYKGLYYHGAESYQQVTYDKDAGSKSATTLVQEGSMVVPVCVSE